MSKSKSKRLSKILENKMCRKVNVRFTSEESLTMGRRSDLIILISRLISAVPVSRFSHLLTSFRLDNRTSENRRPFAHCLAEQL